MTSTLPSHNYNLDWEQFCTRQPTELATELTTLLASTQGNNDQADQRLAAVVGRAATDPTMARLVLQRVMPGIINIAKRRARHQPGSFPEILQELVGNAWIAISTYPLARRPRKIAANLVRDIEYTTFVQPNRLRRVNADMTADIPEITPTITTNPGETLITTLAQARSAGANPASIRLLGELTIAGRSVQDLATAYGVSPRTILNRRLAAEQDLLTHAA